ncbi:MAG: hypothetical protein JNM62_15350 [Flavobacteriales bacterium]|nr:hypothetical protein [Flavobacteriales bacterium]
MIVLMLLDIRIALPNVLLHDRNDRLANMPNCIAHAEDLDQALTRGAYHIEDIFHEPGIP